jgi:hypothetical protein
MRDERRAADRAGGGFAGADEAVCAARHPALLRVAETDRSGGDWNTAPSVGANFRQAYRARSDAEFVSKVGDCLKELEETCYSLELLVEGEIAPAERLAPLQGECHQLTAILTTISKKVKCRAK